MNAKKIKAILFDFDGTLADTAPGIVSTMQETFKAIRLPIPTEEAIRQTIGLKLEEGVKVLGRFDDATAQKGAAIYRELFMKIELKDSDFSRGERNIDNTSANGYSHGYLYLTWTELSKYYPDCKQYERLF